ncbi:MAG: hypothetical protein KIG60_10050 [Caryophanon sp.]|nr:hypothetical protein [Caryophanon sp.]
MFATKTKVTKKKVVQAIEHTFTTEDVLNDLPKAMQQTLATWYKLYTENDAKFFNVANDLKEMDQHLRMHKVMTKKPISTLTEQMTNFFAVVPLEQLLHELKVLYTFTPYHMNDGQFHVLGGFEQKDAQTVSFINSEDAKLPLTISIQAFMLSRLFETELRSALSKYVFTQYVDLQYGSLFETHVKTLEHMAVSELLTSSPAPVATCLYYVFSRQLMRLLKEEFHDEPLFEEIMQLHNAQENAVIGNLERNIGAQKVTQLQLQLKHIKAALADKDAKLEKQKLETKKQKELLKEARATQKVVAPVMTNKEEVQQLQTKVKSLQGEIDTQKQQFALELKTEQREVRKQKSQVEELKAERSALIKQLNEQKQVDAEATTVTIAEWMEIGKPLLEQATAEEEVQLEQFFTMFSQLWTDRRAKQRPQATMNDVFGYYEPRDDGHYIVLANGESHIIEKIPSAIYLRNHQFVRVTENFEFLKSYYYCYYDAPLLAGAQFSIVELVNDVPHVYAGGKLVPLRLKADERALDGQIVAYTRTFELARYYMEKPSNLDDIAASIQLKKHELYHVQQLIGNGAVVVQPFTQQVLYKELPTDHELNVYDTFTYDDDAILHVFRRHAFYESSAYYTKRQLATIEDVTGPCFVRKENRELVILTYDTAHYTPTLGEVIYIDEHHRYLYKVDSEGNREETLEQKLSRSNLYEPKKEKVVFASRDEQHDKPVITVVTRVDFFDSYKNRLSPYYDVTLVDGFGPLEKITQAARKAEVVVLCTSHMSHTTRQKVYDTMPRERVIEDDSQGAQGVQIRLFNYFN